jgi:DNA-binding SARP family transcriptional activator
MTVVISGRSPRPSSNDVPIPTVRILGVVEVAGQRGRAAVKGTLQKSLLGALAFAPGEPVVAERLVQAIWDPAQLPQKPTRVLQALVTKLRAALVDCGLPDETLFSHGGKAYELRVSRSDVDACVFKDIAGSASMRQDQLPTDALGQLRHGLALWRGDPVQDGELFGWAAATAHALVRSRLTAIAQAGRAELRLNRAADVADELETILDDHPEDETLVELLMTALYQVNRHDDALAWFARHHDTLGEKLGGRPSPRLFKLNERILNHDPQLRREVDPSVLRPAQLPARIGHFHGRQAHLQALTDVLDREGDSRVAVVHGAGGMGKTALVVQWAHSVRDRFPDGQIFVDLRGHDDTTAMSPSAVVIRVLTSLGIPAG